MRATMKRPSNKGTFKKGKAPKHPKAGRPKGKPNRTTAILKDAILMAAEQVGENGKGLDGLVGYLRMLAVKERVVYARLLERVMPFQLAVNPSGPQKYTPQEAVEKLRERGMPVPAPLLSLAGGTDTIPSNPVASLVDDGTYEDELNGEGPYNETDEDEPRDPITEEQEQ